MRINTNMAALNAWRNMSVNQSNTQKSLEKLSSGYRINRAADDAAGLAVSEKMRAQIRGTNMATRNAQDGISLVQTAEGALTETHSILQRMRELSVQASTSTLNSEDAAQVSTEFTQLKSEIDRIANNTKFNTKNLLDGQAGVTGTTASTKFKIIGGTGETQAGPATITAVTEASAKVSSIDWGGALATGATVTLNGKSFTFDAAAAVADIAATLNAATAQTGVKATVTGTAIDLATVEKSSAAKLEVSAVGGKTANADPTVALVTGGTNADVTVGGQVIAGIGSRVTIDRGSLKGLTVEVITTDAAANATVNITNRALNIQVGAEAGQQMTVAIGDMSAQGLGVSNLKVTNQSDASNAITSLDTAINLVSSQRAGLGAIQNRLEHTVASLQVTSENLQGAESRIRDVDMASEMASFTKNNILMQASQSMLAQANQSTQGILALLR